MASEKDTFVEVRKIVLGGTIFKEKEDISSDAGGR